MDFFHSEWKDQEILRIKHSGYYLAQKHDIIWSIHTIYGQPKTGQEVLDFIENEEQRFLVLPMYAHYYDNRVVFVVLFHGGIGVISRSLDSIKSLGDLEL